MVVVVQLTAATFRMVNWEQWPLCMWLRGTIMHRVFSFSLVGLICGGRPVHWHAADSVGCGHHVVHQVLLLWESQYLATYLIGSGPRIFWKRNRLNFIYFASVYLNIYNNFFLLDLYSQPSFNKFSNWSVLNFCSTSWLSFSIISICIVFFLFLKLLFPCQLLLSFHSNVILLFIQKFLKLCWISFILQVFVWF